MRDNEENENFIDMGQGKFIWHGGNHENAAVICVRVFFDSNPRFEQTLDWPGLEDDESDFANVKRGPLLTR